MGWDGHMEVAGVASGKLAVLEWVLFMGATAVDLGAVRPSICAWFW